MENTQETYLELVDSNAPKTASWPGAFLISAPLIPIIATVISITVFIIPWPKVQAAGWIGFLQWLQPIPPLFVGTGFALVLWLVFAAFIHRFTTVDHASQDSYDALRKHLSDIDSYVDTRFPGAKEETITMLEKAKPRKPAPQATSTPPVVAAAGQPAQGVTPTPPVVAAAGQPAQQGTSTLDPMEQVRSYRNAIYLGLMQKTTGWVIGTGYTKLWDLVNRAEETLIAYEPLDKVINAAICDEMRLDQSNIQNSDEWKGKLRAAVKDLNTDALRYLKPPIVARTGESQGTVPAEATPGGGNPCVPKELQARGVLQLVRKTINDFDATSWTGLINARAQLVGTTILAGLMTYVIVEFFIVILATREHMEVALIFAFVGALVGLFSRLYSESQSTSPIDDYRLARARLIVAPLLSGLAAVIGVLVVAQATNLGDLYNFKNILSNLVIAAVFGLTPNLLIDQLQKKSDGYKSNLQSTQPTTGK